MHLDLEFCGRNVLQSQSSQALLGIRRMSGNRFYGETPAMAMSVVLHFVRSLLELRMVACHNLWFKIIPSSYESPQY